MTGPGRNDPCPCGSGKKYKKCCLAKDEALRRGEPSASSRASEDLSGKFRLPTASAEEQDWGFTLRERESAIEKLFRFASRREFKEDWDIAYAIFAGAGLVTAPEERIDEAMESDVAQINFNSWVLYDMNLDEGQSIANLFLQRRGHDLSIGERTYIEKALAAHFRLYEILEVHPDEGFTLRDLANGETHRIHEKMATHFLVQWDVVAMRLMDYGGGYVCIDVGIIPFPRADKESLLKEMARLKKQIEAPTEVLFFKRVVPMLNHLWLKQTLNPQMPKLLTAEGDPMLFTEVHFDVTDTSALRRSLDAADDLDREEENAWGWSQPHPEGGLRSLGRIVLQSNRLTLEANSKERGERGREYLEWLAGHVLTHRATEHQTVEQALKERKAAGKRPEPESGIPDLSPEEERQIILQYLDDHYHKWPDMPLPALKGKTPRQAAAKPRSRPKVVDLLKQLEHNEALGALHDVPAYDFTWLWEELGIDRDKETRG